MSASPTVIPAQAVIQGQPALLLGIQDHVSPA